MRLSDPLIEEMQAYWRRRTGERISSGEANEALRNVVQFVDLLSEWDRASQAEDAHAMEGVRAEWTNDVCGITIVDRVIVAGVA